MYEIEEYITEAGEKPFAEWLNDLRDIQAKKKILGRITQKILGAMGLRIGVSVEDRSLLSSHGVVQEGEFLVS